jgi:RNA recognition motif-containing protein
MELMMVRYNLLFIFIIIIINYDFSLKEKLRKYFSTYGPVQDAVVMKDPISRRSRGFGFITFCDLDSVDNALAHEPHTIDARKVSFYININLLLFINIIYVSLFN